MKKLRVYYSPRGRLPMFCVSKFDLTLIKLTKIDVPAPLQDQQVILK